MKRRFCLTILMVLLLTILQACIPFGKSEKTKSTTQNTKAATVTAKGSTQKTEAPVEAPAQAGQSPTDAAAMPPAKGTEISMDTPVPLTDPLAGTVEPEAVDDEVEGTPTPTSPPPQTPSELSVAYTDSNGDVWMWTTTGGSKQLTSGGGVQELMMSEDGTLIAFVRAPDFAEYSLWAINADGSNERQLVSKEELDQIVRGPISDEDTLELLTGGSIYMFNWVPGTHNIAFTTAPLIDSSDSLFTDDLWLVNADTSDKKQLLEPGNGGLFYYSPDGTQIALSYLDRVSLVNADGSNRRDSVLSFTEVNTDSDTLFMPTPVWSIDSSQLYVVIPPEDPENNPDDPTAIYRIPVAGGQPTKITSVVTTALTPVEFSPNMSYFAYVKEVGDEDEGISELHIGTTDGSNDDVVQSAQLSFVGWAPDSTHFLFALEGDTNIQYATLDGNYVQMTDQEYPEGVQWANVNSILFLNMGDENWQIFLGEPGKSSTQIVMLDGDPNLFSPTYDFHE